MSKHNIFHGNFVFQGGKLIPATGAQSEKYKLFLQGLSENQKVDIFLEANEDNGTLAQLAKVHVCTRELAKTLGYTFEEMKMEVKRSAGLCVPKIIDGKAYMFCKSFGDCSREELGAVMETLTVLGESAGINFNQYSENA